MARIIYPEDFLTQKLLFNNVKAKHDSYVLPAVSPIEAYLTAQGISLANDDLAKDNASGFEETRLEKSKQAENFTEKRNKKFDPVFGHLRDYGQFLKKFYKPIVSELGNWGFPVTVSGRINYPNEFPQRTVLFDALKAKYDSYLPPGTSPLDPYLTQHALVLTNDMTAVSDARNFHLQAKQLAKDAEDATEDRNNEWNPVVEHLRMIGGFLMGLYNNNPKELGNWGYVVDDSPREPKQIVSKVKLSSSAVISNCIIGGTFKNIGSVPLNVYKGGTASGAFVTVAPGEMYGIAKGFSTITVVNTSAITTAVFSVLRHR